MNNMNNPLNRPPQEENLPPVEAPFGEGAADAAAGYQPKNPPPSAGFNPQGQPQNGYFQQSPQQVPPGVPTGAPPQMPPPPTARPPYGYQNPYSPPPYPPYGGNGYYGQPQWGYYGGQNIQNVNYPTGGNQPGSPYYSPSPYPPQGGRWGEGLPQPPYGYPYPYGAPVLSPEQAQLQAEKKAVKKTANRIGGGILLFFAVALVFSLILGVVMAIFGMGENVFEDFVFLEVYNIVVTLFGFGLLSFFVFKTERLTLKRMPSFGRPKKGKFLPMVMAGIGLCYVGNIVTAIISSLLPEFFFESYNMPVPDKGILNFIIAVIGTAIFPALLEEFAFRGVIMGSLLKFGKPFAIFTSAFLFALLHGNMVQIPFTFVAGLGFGYAVAETGSIWTGIVIHFINNFLSVCLEFAGIYLGEDIQNAIYLLLLATILLVGFFGVYLLSHKNKDFLKFQRTPHISTSRTRFGWLCSAATIIIFFVYTGISIFSA